MRRKRLSEDERAARRDADRQKARDAVEALKTSEGWQRWLSLRRHFHRYSLANQLLIALQKPDATRVAGFRAWLKLGHAVGRGERAIKIWVPVTPSKTKLDEWRAAGADPTERPRTWFRLGPVFDRSQVEPLPPPAEPVPLDPPIATLEGDGLAWAWPQLVRLARVLGSDVVLRTLPHGCGGSYDRATLAITINDAASVNQRVKTLVHEIGHALVRAEPREDEAPMTYDEEEFVVESVAFTLCGSLGFDTDGYSIPYLASWSEGAELETIERAAALIDRIARRVDSGRVRSVQRRNSGCRVACEARRSSQRSGCGALRDSEEGATMHGPQGPHPTSAHRWHTIPVLIALAVAAACSPSLAAADFSPRFGIANGAYPSYAASVEMDATGDAVIAWEGPAKNPGSTATHPATWVRWRGADGTMPHRQLVSADKSAAQHDLAVNAAGAAALVWTETYTQARLRAADGALLRLNSVSGPQAATTHPRAAIDGAGNGIFVFGWRNAFGYAFVAFNQSMPDGRTVGVHRLYGDWPYWPPTELQFAANTAGEGVVVWVERPGSGPSVVKAAAIHPIGSWPASSTPRTISVGSRSADSPVVGIDTDGRATIVWRTTGADQRMHVRRRAPDGTLSDVRPLVATSTAVNRPAIAVNPGGDAVAVWQRDDGTSQRVDVRAIAPDGTLSERNTLTPPGGSALTPSVAIDAAGRSVIGWHRRIVYPDGNPAYIPQARRRAADGTLSPIETLYSDPQAGRTDHADSVLVKVAMDPAGNALAVWTRNNPEGGATILGAASAAPPGDSG